MKTRQIKQCTNNFIKIILPGRDYPCDGLGSVRLDGGGGAGGGGSPAILFLFLFLLASSSASRADPAAPTAACRRRRRVFVSVQAGRTSRAASAETLGLLRRKWLLAESAQKGREEWKLTQFEIVTHWNECGNKIVKQIPTWSAWAPQPAARRRCAAVRRMSR